MGTGATFVGLTTLDIAYAVEIYPAEDSKTRAADMFMAAGGPAANAAVAYAFLARGGAKLATVLGTHPLTQPIRADLREFGIEVWDQALDPEQRPPVSSIVVARESGSRTIVSLDDSRTSGHRELAEGRLLAGARVLLVDGHYPELAVQAAGMAKDSGVPVVLDGGRWRPEHRKLLPLIDFALCSSSFTPPELPPGDVGALLDFVLACGPRAVAVTDGARPIRWATTDARGAIPVSNTGADAVDTDAHAGVLDTDAHIVDTLGAGDILHGAFCHFHERGEDFPTALRHAAEVATFSCRYLGTREWMRHWRAATGDA
ncbi:sugar kinase [Nocardia sp. 2]|uniref:Sugar kinase n=1 Tax=Nocardia acididurans TaxID=2802282 RepID=A0ABS1MAR7_9NOCA|nr:PfkB family carbohydrate kinase [Nocardia acididurans]MBL1077344.1 sugar kinase [Nocardia acididurans]